MPGSGNFTDLDDAWLGGVEFFFDHHGSLLPSPS